MRDGYASTTQAMVASEVGVTRGAVQYHFRTPDDLMQAISEDVGQQLMAACELPATLLKHELTQRANLMIDATWQLLGSAEFAATIHIWLGANPSGRLAEQVSVGVQRVEQRLDDAWVFLFSDTGIRREDVLAIRHLIFSTLRGLVLRVIVTRQPLESVAAEVTMLKSWVTSALRQAV
jgi:AcrR family transcriptional regulator